MSTTREEIRAWLEAGITRGATHTIVVCDTFDHEDYPVHVMPTEDVRKRYDEYNGKEMQRVMEVYALHLDLEAQLSEHRSFHFESPSEDIKVAQKARAVVRQEAGKCLLSDQPLWLPPR